MQSKIVPENVITTNRVKDHFFSPKKIVPSLFSIILEKLALDLKMTLAIIQDDRIESDIKQYFIEYSPWVTMLDYGMETQIVLMLPLENWPNLFLTSTRWKTAVERALDTVLTPFSAQINALLHTILINIL